MGRHGFSVVGVLAVLALVCGGTAAAAVSCPPVDGVKELLRPGAVVLLGEQHGTVESPEFAFDLVCHAANAGLAVRFGIEISNSEQSRFNAFLDSSGHAASRQTLIEGAPWQADRQYGVTSEGMYDLLDGLRQLRGDGHDVEVVLFNKSAGSGQARDRRMAEHLATTAEESREGIVIVLTGNVHSRVTTGTRWDADYEPMGYLLTQTIAPDRVVSLDVAHNGGTAWLCVAGDDSCGSRGLRGRGPESDGVSWNDSPDATGHHGWYQVGSITVSPPARDTHEAEVLWEFETDG